MNRGRQNRYKKNNREKNYELASFEKAELTFRHARNSGDLHFPSQEEVVQQFKSGCTNKKVHEMWKSVMDICKHQGKTLSEFYFDVTQKQPVRLQRGSNTGFTSDAHTTNPRFPQNNSTSDSNSFGSHGVSWPSNVSADCNDTPSSMQLTSRSSYTNQHHFGGGGEMHNPPSYAHDTQVVKNKRPSQAVYAPPIPGRNYQHQPSNVNSPWMENDNPGSRDWGEKSGKTRSTDNVGRGGNGISRRRIVGNSGYVQKDLDDDWGMGGPAGGQASGWDKEDVEDWTEEVNKENRSSRQGSYGERSKQHGQMSQYQQQSGYKVSLQNEKKVIERQQPNWQTMRSNQEFKGQKMTENQQDTVQPLIRNQQYGQRGQHARPNQQQISQNMIQNQQHIGPIMIQNQQQSGPNKMQNQPHLGQNASVNQDQQQLLNALGAPVVTNGSVPGCTVSTEQSRMTGEHWNEGSSSKVSSSSSTPEPGELQRIPSQEFESPVKHNHFCMANTLNYLRKNAGESTPVNVEGKSKFNVQHQMSTEVQNKAKPVTVNTIHPVTILKRPAVFSTTESKTVSQSLQDLDKKSEPLKQQGITLKAPVPKSPQTEASKISSQDSVGSSQQENEDGLNSIDLSEYFPSCSNMNWAEEASLYLPPTPTSESVPDGPYQVPLHLKNENVSPAVSEYIPPPPPQSEAVEGNVGAEQKTLTYEAGGITSGEPKGHVLECGQVGSKEDVIEESDPNDAKHSLASGDSSIVFLEFKGVKQPASSTSDDSGRKDGLERSSKNGEFHHSHMSPSQYLPPVPTGAQIEKADDLNKDSIIREEISDYSTVKDIPSEAVYSPDGGEIGENDLRETISEAKQMESEIVTKEDFSDENLDHSYQSGDIQRTVGSENTKVSINCDSIVKPELCENSKDSILSISSDKQEETVEEPEATSAENFEQETKQSNEMVLSLSGQDMMQRQILASQRFNCLEPRSINCDMSQTFGKTQMKSPTWISKTPLDLSESPEKPLHGSGMLSNPMTSTIVGDSVIAEGALEVSPLPTSRPINTPETGVLSRGSVTVNQNHHTSSALVTDPWSTQNGLLAAEINATRSAPGSYKGSLNSAEAEGDNYAAWITQNTDNNSGYCTQSVGLGSGVTPGQLSASQPAPGSYQGPSKTSRASGHYPNYPRRQDPVSHYPVRFPQDQGSTYHSRPPQTSFREDPQVYNDYGGFNQRDIQGFLHGNVPHTQHMPPLRQQISHMPMPHPAAATTVPPVKPLMDSPLDTRAFSYLPSEHLGHAAPVVKDNNTHSGAGGYYDKKKQQPSAKSQNKGIRKVHVAGNLVSRDDALSTVEHVIESASKFKPAPSKVKSPDIGDGGLKTRIHYEETLRMNQQTETMTTVKPKENMPVKKRVSFEKTDTPQKDTGNTSKEPRSPVDLMNIPIVFKKAAVAPCGVKTNSGPEQALDVKKTEPTPQKNPMSVARKAMEAAVSQRKKQASKVVWGEASDCNIGQFFVNKVYLDKEKTRLWLPKHLEGKHTHVLSFEEVVPFTDLQMAVVVNSTWIKDIVEYLIQFPKDTNLTVICPKISGDCPLYEDAHEQMNAPFTICPTHQHTMKTEGGMLLEPSCRQTDGCTDKRELTLIHPYKSSTCNSKFYLLRYPHTVRLVVFSGLLNSLNWERLGQFGWFCDFPIQSETAEASENDLQKEEEAGTSNAEQPPSCELSDQLYWLLHRLGVTDVTLSNLFTGVKFDTLSPHVRLITSCPELRVSTDRCSYGIPKLHQILKETSSLHMSGDVKKVCQTSKLGTGNGMLHLKELLGVRDGFQKRRDSGLSVVYPSKHYIRSQCDNRESHFTEKQLSRMFSNGDKSCHSEKYLKDPSHEELVIPHANILLSYQVIQVSQEKEKMDVQDPPTVDKTSTLTSQTQSISSKEQNSDSNTEVPKPAVAMNNKNSAPNGPNLSSVSSVNSPLEPGQPCLTVQTSESEQRCLSVQRQQSQLTTQSLDSDETLTSTLEPKDLTVEAKESQRPDFDVSSLAIELSGSNPGQQKSAQPAEEASLKKDVENGMKERHCGWFFTGSQTVGYGSWGGHKSNVWNFARFELGVGLFPYMDEEKNEVHSLDLQGVGFLCDYSKLVPYPPARLPYTPIHEWTKDNHKFYRCIGIAARTMSERNRSGGKAVFIDFFREDDPLMKETDFECFPGARSALMRPSFQHRGQRKAEERLPALGTVVEFVASAGDKGFSTDPSCVVHQFRDKWEAMKYYGIDASKYPPEEQEMGSSRENWRKRTPVNESAQDRKTESYQDIIGRLGLKTDEDVDNYWEKKFQGIHMVTKVNRNLPYLDPKADKIECRVTNLETDMQYLEKSAQEKGYGSIPKTLMGVFCVDLMQQQMEGHRTRFHQGHI